VLRDLADILGGGTPSKSCAEFYAGSIPWVSPKDFKGHEILDALDHISQAALDQSATRLIPAGAVLVVLRSGVLKHRLPVAINRVPVAINQDVKAFICGAELDPNYLAHFLRYKAPKLLQRVRATTADNLPIDVLADLDIPVPDKFEQAHIAATLDKAERIRQSCKQFFGHCDELLRSVFKELIAKARVTDCCSVSPFGTLIERIETGTSVGGDDRILQHGEWGVLKVSAVTWGTFDAEAYKAVDPRRMPANLVIPKRGDLLFSRANTRELVGRTCIVDVDVERLFLPDKLWRIVPKPEKATPEFLHFALSDPQARFALTRTATGTSGSMLNISQTKLLDLPIPVPPIHIQAHFSRIARHVMALRAAKIEQARQADRLSSSLNRLTFSGAW
jgi:type I restriction enzyme S subunit